jgi:hypothetical protein
VFAVLKKLVFNSKIKPNKDGIIKLIIQSVNVAAKIPISLFKPDGNKLHTLMAISPRANNPNTGGNGILV